MRLNDEPTITVTEIKRINPKASRANLSVHVEYMGCVVLKERHFETTRRGALRLYD